LDASVSGALVIRMFAALDDPYTQLRPAIQDLLDRTAGQELDFAEVDLADERGPWGLVRAVLRCSDATPGFKASKVTKMLHRKRPTLVPIFDSKIAAFYGTSSRTPWRLWLAVQQDLRGVAPWLDQLATGVRTPDGRPISRLRVLDIVIWEHETSCAAASAPRRSL
jgi:hypothetical protein